MRTVLVTGATGALGSAIVPLFLNDGASEVELLLRAEADDGVAGRLDGLFAFWSSDVDEVRARERIRAWRGDVSMSRLGLREDDYASLARRVTHIVHCAASVKMDMTVEEADRACIEPTRQILALAEACRAQGQFRKLEYVSTLGVAGCLSGTIPEDRIGIDRRYHNTYESAKAEAERLVFAALDRGLPVTIHRPSMIVGHSVTGKIISFQVFYFLARFLSGRLTHGILPRVAGMTLDVIPADYVARAVHWSSGTDASAGRILHLCSGPERAVPLMEMAQEIASFYDRLGGGRRPPLRFVPFPIFRFMAQGFALAAGSSGIERFKKLAPFFAFARDRQSFANARSRELLAREAGLSVPKVNDYLPAVLEFHLDARERHLGAA